MATKKFFSDENFVTKYSKIFVRNGFSDENFRHYMCLDFLKNSFSDEIFSSLYVPELLSLNMI